jgi:hypothetical protein
MQTRNSCRSVGELQDDVPPRLARQAGAASRT